jgi:hypothetical protein
MTPTEIIGALQQSPADADRFRICSRLKTCFFARSPSGRAALLIPCSSSGSRLGRATGSVLLTFKSRVVFDVDGDVWSAPSVVLECLEEGLLHTFVALGVDLAGRLEQRDTPPRPEEVAHALAAWERLLRNRPTLSEERQLGLWGELEFIRASPSIDGAIRAWNPDPLGVIDFIAGGVGVEMKTSTTRLRHVISHRQRQSVGGDLRVILGSLWVVPDAVGVTLNDLVRAIDSVCTETVAFEQKLLATGFSRRDSDVYSRRFSVGSPLLLFDGGDVPRIREFDPGITSIHYTVELDPSDAVAPTEAAELLGRLCGAVMGTRST